MNRISIVIHNLAATCVAANFALAPASASSQVLDLAAELGLSPECIVVSGVASYDASFVPVMLSRIEQATDAAQELNGIREHMDSLGNELSHLSALLRLRPEDEELLSDHAAVAASLVSVQQQCDALLGALSDEVFDGLPVGVIERIQVWRATSQYAVPPALRTSAREPAVWKSIETALRAEQRAQRTGGTLDSESSTLLAAIRGEQDVIAAEYLLATQLSSLQQVFASFEAP